MSLPPKKLELLILHCRSWRDSLLDLWYGGWFGGIIRTRFARLGANDTQSSFYHVMRAVFAHRPLTAGEVVVDVGCGKGRVIRWLIAQGYGNQLLGIELDEAIAARTRRRFAGSANVEIIAGNALEHIPAEATLFYLYNPFSAATMIRFKDLLRDKFAGKRILILYVNHAHLDVFVGDPAWTVSRTPYPYEAVSPEWPVIDIGLSPPYPVAFIELQGEVAVGWVSEALCSVPPCGV